MTELKRKDSLTVDPEAKTDPNMANNLMPWPEFRRYWDVLVKRGWKLAASPLGEHVHFNVDRSTKLGSRSAVVAFVKNLLETETESSREAEEKKEAERKAKETAEKEAASLAEQKRKVEAQMEKKRAEEEELRRRSRESMKRDLERKMQQQIAACGELDELLEAVNLEDEDLSADSEIEDDEGDDKTEKNEKNTTEALITVQAMMRTCLEHVNCVDLHAKRDLRKEACEFAESFVNNLIHKVCGGGDHEKKENGKKHGNQTNHANRLPEILESSDDEDDEDKTSDGEDKPSTDPPAKGLKDTPTFSHLGFKKWVPERMAYSVQTMQHAKKRGNETSRKRIVAHQTMCVCDENINTVFCAFVCSVEGKNLHRRRLHQIHQKGDEMFESHMDMSRVTKTPSDSRPSKALQAKMKILTEQWEKGELKTKELPRPRQKDWSCKTPLGAKRPKKPVKPHDPADFTTSGGGRQRRGKETGRDKKETTGGDAERDRGGNSHIDLRSDEEEHDNGHLDFSSSDNDLDDGGSDEEVEEAMKAFQAQASKALAKAQKAAEEKEALKKKAKEREELTTSLNEKMRKLEEKMKGVNDHNDNVSLIIIIRCEKRKIRTRSSSATAVRPPQRRWSFGFK